MSKEAISQIENFFLEIENLIELRIQNKVSDEPEIEQKFKEGIELINVLEGENDDQHRLFRYKYHITYANYLKKSYEADKQEKLEKPETYRAESVLFREAKLEGSTNQSSSSSSDEENIQNIQKAFEEEIEKLRDILNHKIIESIQYIFKKFNDTTGGFEYYRNIVESEATLYRLADGVINETLIINMEESNTNDKSEQQDDQNSKVIKKNRNQVISSLNLLKKLTTEAAYLKRLASIHHILNSPNKKEILFSNVVLTEEEINKRFKELALYFHPDKTNTPNTPFWFQDKHKNLGLKVFNFALGFKEALLEDLEKFSESEGPMAYHEKTANDLWKITIDYRNAAKGQWNKLKLLNKCNIEGYSSDELKQFSVYTGTLAYKKYRAACKIADKSKELKKQVELRGYMALCLYVSNKFIEAQLYALSAIHLQLKNSQKFTQQEFNETKKIFDKVKGGNDEASSNLKTEIRVNPNDALALVEAVDKEISFFEKRELERSINNDITNMGIELVIKANRNLVRYQVPQEEISRDKKRAFMNQIVGETVITGAGTTSLAVALKAVTLIRAGAAVAAVPAGIIIISGIVILGTLGGLLVGIWCGSKLFQKGSLLYKEPEIRENLNKIMVEILKAYDKGEYQEFIYVLSKEYTTGESLLKLEGYRIKIDPDNIIDTLLKHGFRSDGVAYLLNLLGEVLSSGRIKIEGKTTNELKVMAKDVLDGTLNEKLEIEAKKLDDRIYELRKYHRINHFGTFDKIKNFLKEMEYSYVAKEYKDDAQEMPFMSRLEEMRNIARINKAIFYIVDGGKEEIKRAIETIKDVKDSIYSNYQFVNMAKWRCEVLEDLLWVVSGEEPPDIRTISYEIQQIVSDIV